MLSYNYFSCVEKNDCFECKKFNNLSEANFYFALNCDKNGIFNQKNYIFSLNNLFPTFLEPLYLKIKLFSKFKIKMQ